MAILLTLPSPGWAQEIESPADNQPADGIVFAFDSREEPGTIPGPPPDSIPYRFVLTGIPRDGLRPDSVIPPPGGQGWSRDPDAIHVFISPETPSGTYTVVVQLSDGTRLEASFEHMQAAHVAQPGLPAVASPISEANTQAFAEPRLIVDAPNREASGYFNYGIHLEGGDVSSMSLDDIDRALHRPIPVNVQDSRRFVASLISSAPPASYDISLTLADGTVVHATLQHAAELPGEVVGRDNPEVYVLRGSVRDEDRADVLISVDAVKRFLTMQGLGTLQRQVVFDLRASAYSADAAPSEAKTEHVIVLHTENEQWRTSAARAPQNHHIGNVAHEYFHIMQYEWLGEVAGWAATREPPDVLPDWLIEGSADVIANRTADAMGYLKYADYVACRDNRVARAALGPLPPLSRLASKQTFVHISGSQPAYDTGAMAVDILVRDRGLGALKAYFESIQRVGGLAAFKLAFGQDLDAFYSAFEAHLEALRPDQSRPC